MIVRPAVLVLALCVPQACSAAQQPGGDFSTPTAAVQTFLTAIAERNADLLAECFSAASGEEFADIREKRLTAGDWREIQSMFRNAGIVEVSWFSEESGEATVVVRLPAMDDDEQLHMQREGENWRIAGF